MKLIKLSVIIFNILILSDLQALDSDNELEYLEKNKKQALEIVKFKDKVMQERKEQELLKAKEEQARKEQEEKERYKLFKIQEAFDKERLSKAEKEKVRQKEVQKLALAKRLKQEEIFKKLNRKNTIKIVRLADKDKGYLATEEYITTRRSDIISQKKPKTAKLSDTDNVELNLNKNQYSVVKYGDVGHEEIYATAAVDRSNILSNDIYVSLIIQTSISSRRAASFVALLERNVYSPDTTDVLLPKGSKFICNFETLATGETAINARCNEIILPNGKKIRIDDMPVYDQMGRVGIVGVLDNRLWEKYGQAFITSGLGAAGMFLASKTPTTSDSKNLFNYTALNAIDVSNNILKNTINLAPIVTVSSGTRILVRLTKVINFMEEDESEENNIKD